MLRKLLLTLCLFVAFGAFAQREVIYQVYPRSFYDTNKDGYGDLEGVRQKLGYLQWMGINTILLTPVYEAGDVMNYYASNWAKVDVTYGAFKGYRDLIQEAHRRKMKVYLDFDLRYVTKKHDWFTKKEDYKNCVLPDKNIDYVSLTGENAKAYAVNFKEAKVRGEIVKMLEYWINPTGSPIYYAGADGLRFSNVADEFEGQKNLLREFWVPVIKGIKDFKADVTVMAYPADDKAQPADFYNVGFDVVFDTNLNTALRSFDKGRIEKAAISLIRKDSMPETKRIAVFAEDNYAGRFSTIRIADSRQVKTVSALNLLLGGIPSVYYGQETGSVQIDELAGTESVNWSVKDSVSGNALWFNPLAGSKQMVMNKVPVDEQIRDKESDCNFFREIIRNKNLQPALALGDYVPVTNTNEKAISFLRMFENEKVLVVVNLSDERQSVYIEPQMNLKLNNTRMLIGDESWNFKRGGRVTTLPPYAIAVWRFN